MSAGHGTAVIQLGYLDTQGNVLNVTEMGLKADVAFFKDRQVIPVQSPAPPGTAFCRAQFEVITPDGAVQMWVGYPELIVQ